ncbi:hypothetical protein DVH05_021906 [Phytophthora capsici]|nr:hypothetical protein DVH05_021906 [Phytophthora capsici]
MGADDNSLGGAEPLTEDEIAETAAVDALRESVIESVDTFIGIQLNADERAALAKIRTTVGVFRAVAVYFHKSQLGTNCLRAIQKEDLTVPDPLTSVVDCPTRWSSCLDMLHRLLELKPAIELFFLHLLKPEGKKEFPRLRLKRPSASDWLTIECLMALLAPFALATRSLGGQDYPTLAHS